MLSPYSDRLLKVTFRLVQSSHEITNEPIVHSALVTVGKGICLHSISHLPIIPFFLTLMHCNSFYLLSTANCYEFIIFSPLSTAALISHISKNFQGLFLITVLPETVRS